MAPSLTFTETEDAFMKEQLYGKAEALVRALLSCGATAATAESCTGGLIAKLITDVPGSSAAFVGGVVSYTNEVKMTLLDVDPAIIEEHTEVSLHELVKSKTVL